MRKKNCSFEPEEPLNGLPNRKQHKAMDFYLASKSIPLRTFPLRNNEPLAEIVTADFDKTYIFTFFVY